MFTSCLGAVTPFFFDGSKEMDTSRASSKRKRENEPNLPNKRPKNDPLTSVLPPFFYQTHPAQFARFDAQLCMLGKQLDACQVSDEVQREIATRLRDIFKMNITEEQRLAEFTALSVLLDQGLLVGAQIGRCDSFLHTLKKIVLLEMSALEDEDRIFKKALSEENEASNTIFFYSLHRMAEWFASILYLQIGMNPGADALASYLLEKTNLRRFVPEDYLHHLRGVISALACNNEFIQGCAESIPIHPDMIRYVNLILLRHPQTPLNHHQTVIALLVCLLSRVRQTTGPHCYAIAAQIKRTQNEPFQMFMCLRNIFAKGEFQVSNVRLPAHSCIQLAIVPSDSLLSDQRVGHFQNISLIKRICRTNDLSVNFQEKASIRTILSKASALEMLVYQLNRIATLPLFVQVMLEGLNMCSLQMKKLFFKEMEDFFSNSVASLQHLEPEFKEKLKEKLNKCFFFFDPPLQGIKTFPKKVVVLSGLYQGEYPYPDSCTEKEVVKGLQRARIVVYYDGQEIKPCQTFQAFKRSITHLLETFPCSPDYKQAILDQITAVSFDDWIGDLMHKVGKVNRSLATILTKKQILFFHQAGGRSIEEFDDSCKEHRIGDVTMDQEVVTRLTALSQVIQSRRASDPSILISCNLHAFTSLPSFWPEHLEQTVQKAQLVAKSFLEKPVSPLTIRQFFNCLNRSKSEAWLAQIEVNQRAFTYQQAIETVASSRFPVPKEEISKVFYEKVIKQKVTSKQVETMIRQLVKLSLVREEQVVEKVYHRLKGNQVNSFEIAQLIGVVLTEFELSYIPIAQIEKAVREVLHLPERIYLGDTNYMNSSGSTVWRVLEYNMAHQKWLAVDENGSASAFSIKNLSIYLQK